MNKLILATLGMTFSVIACNHDTKKEIKENESEFAWQIDRFSDLAILRYQVPGFEQLTVKQKTLIFYLNQAALCGRDILFDQNYKHNLCIRKTLESIYLHYNGDKQAESWKQFEDYLKRVWFSNGIHHHYSTDKFKPEFSEDYFKSLLSQIKDADLPLQKDETRASFTDKIATLLFASEVDAKRVNLDSEQDIIASSANNFYENVTQKEADDYYKKQHDVAKNKELSFGLNSKLVKENGILKEQVYKVGGMYSPAIEKIVYWLSKAENFAENAKQKETIKQLIEFYKTGDLETFDKYNIAWVEDTISHIDFVNGFIEVYGDAAGRKATWESIVNFKDEEATKRTEIISANAQWFEDHSPVDPKFKKKTIKGVSAKVITIAMLGGDCYPSTPIGINLPNSSWIRKNYGSKSVSLENICYAYDQATVNSGSIEEFAFDKAQVERAKKYGYASSNLHTDLHECLGHGSGQLMPGVKTDDLKNYHSTIEEARADLFALYYMLSPKIYDLKLLPSIEAAKAEYDGYIRGGLMTQLKRIELGKNIEESHMRNRQLIAKWVYEKGKAENVIEKVVKKDKTYFVIRDYSKLNVLFGDLLKEIQRITSEGDFNAAKALVENYGVTVDINLHKEVLKRFEKLDLPSYRGFVNPDYTPVYGKDSAIVDVKITYPDNYVQQMLKYSKEYSFLPIKN
jgi:dipeptidyl-peptidase III